MEKKLQNMYLISMHFTIYLYRKSYDKLINKSFQ